MLSCDDIERDLDDFLDGWIEPHSGAQFERHCAHCDYCRGRVEAARALEQRLRMRFESEPVPPSLWPRVYKATSARAERLGRLRAMATWLGAIAATALLMAVGIAAFLPASNPRSDEQRAAVLVNEMRTFVVSRRTLDVPSTDPLALRAWFVDKVDFTPPSPPNAGGALELIGGRLCNLLDRRVISFMYRADGGFVSLYVMRDAEGTDDGPRAGPRGGDTYGFNHVGWTNAGLRYALVAALPPERLTALARALMQDAESSLGTGRKRS